MNNEKPFLLGFDFENHRLIQTILTNAINERDAAINERDAAINERDAAINERDAAINELDKITNLRIWRFTALYRNLRKRQKNL